MFFKKMLSFFLALLNLIGFNLIGRPQVPPVNIADDYAIRYENLIYDPDFDLNGNLPLDTCIITSRKIVIGQKISLCLIDKEGGVTYVNNVVLKGLKEVVVLLNFEKDSIQFYFQRHYDNRSLEKNLQDCESIHLFLTDRTGNDFIAQGLLS